MTRAQRTDFLVNAGESLELIIKYENNGTPFDYTLSTKPADGRSSPFEIARKREVAAEWWATQSPEYKRQHVLRWRSGLNLAENARQQWKTMSSDKREKCLSGLSKGRTSEAAKKRWATRKLKTMPTSTKVQLIGGGFCDAEGRSLANGSLQFELSQDCVTADNVNTVTAGIVVVIQLDAQGNVFGTQISDTPKQYIWPNDQLLPAGTYYTVTAYTSEGQLAFAYPQIQTVLSTPSPFNLGIWIPNNRVPPQDVELLADLGDVHLTGPTSGQLLEFNGTKWVNYTPATSAVTYLPRPDQSSYAYWRVPAPSNGCAYTPPTFPWFLVNDITTTNMNFFEFSFVGASSTAGPTFICTDSNHATQFTGQSWVTMTRPITMRGTIQYSAATIGAVCKHYVGLSDYGNTPIAYNNLIAIGLQKVGGSPNPNFILWIQYVASPPSLSNTPVLIDTGVPVVNGQRYKWVMTISGGVVTLFINGVQVATSSTTLPTVNMAITWGAETSGSINSSTGLEYIYCEQATP